MADDPMRAKARSTFGKSFMDAAKARPLAKNAATASQKVANDRPIPTYKVGGPVKKAAGGVMPERIAARMAAGNYAMGGKVQTSADTARKLATEMGGMKDGGSCGMKPVKKAVGGAGKVRKGCMNKYANGGGVKKADAEYTRGAMKAEADEVRNMDKLRKSAPAKKPRKPDAEYTPGAMKAEADEVRYMDKLAKGGAAKVRKGMMSPKGAVLQAVKPKKGLGGIM